MRKGVRKAQLNLSFGMIFSIILIIAFLAFAFYAIYKFLDFQNSAKILQFSRDFQDDIDRMWKSVQGSYEAEYSLPQKVEAVCIVNNEYENMIFQSKNYIDGRKIEHIDMAKTLGGSKSLCFENVRGKVRMIIKKNYEDSLVTIVKNE